MHTTFQIAKWNLMPLQVENYAVKLKLYKEQLGPGAECVVEKVVEADEKVKEVGEKVILGKDFLNLKDL